MSDFNHPITFFPILKSKTWGGRKLKDRLGRALPDEGPFGESWELCGLPADLSVAASVPFVGKTLAEITRAAPRAILGERSPTDWVDQFPLLIKYLDAREPLSVQVHPRPPASDVKHEAWYIVEAEKDAAVYIGLRPGVNRYALQQAVERGDHPSTYLNTYPASAGACFNLPSGVVHALGGGILVAEIQTPSDTTYRLYDWGRVDRATRQPRALHMDEGLRNTREDIDPDEVIRPREAMTLDTSTGAQLCVNDRFVINELALNESPCRLACDLDRFAIIMVVGGSGSYRSELVDDGRLRLGDVLLVPAACGQLSVTGLPSMKLLMVKPQ